MCSGSQTGSYFRLIDSCITQIKAKRPFRTFNESKEEEEGVSDTEVEGLAEHLADASDGEHEKEVERHADHPPG